MAIKSNDRQWGSVARTFHWLVALLIIVNGTLGLYMTDLKPGMDKISIYAIHKSIGLTVLALFLLRLSWRWFDPRPRDLPMPRWQKLAAHAAHGALYLLMAAIPLSGWLFNSAHGNPLQWFKLFNLPALLGKNEALADFFQETHETLFWILVVIFVAHVGGALMHHFAERDNTLRRMLPFSRRLGNNVQPANPSSTDRSTP